MGSNIGISSFIYSRFVQYILPKANDKYVRLSMKFTKTLHAHLLDLLYAWAFSTWRSSKKAFFCRLYPAILSKPYWSHYFMMMPSLEIFHIDRSEKLLYLLNLGTGISWEKLYSASEIMADPEIGTGFLNPGKGRNPVPILICGTSKGYSKKSPRS